MPATMKDRIPNDSALGDKGNEERQDRAKRIKGYWAYYTGQHVPQLKVLEGQYDDNVTINMAGSVVDRGVAFMLPAPPRLSLPSADTAVDVVPEQGAATQQRGAADVAERALQEFVRANDIEMILWHALTAGFVTGHTFFKLVPQPGIPYVRVVHLKTENVTVWWDALDVTRVKWYEVHWQYDDDQWRQDIFPENDTWVLEDWVKRKHASRWERKAREVWPYPFSPIIDFPNWPVPHQYYGMSDLAHGILNDALNFTVSNMLKIIRHHGGPQTVVIGADAPKKGDDVVGPDTIIYLPQGASIHNLEMISDLGASLQIARMLRSAFFAQVAVVDPETYREDLPHVTNFGLRVIYTDMLHRTHVKREIVGRGLAAMCQRALAARGLRVPMPQVFWADPLPTSDMETAQVQAIDQQLGIKSKQTMASERGLDWDEERERIAAEQAEDSITAAENLIRFGGR